MRELFQEDSLMWELFQEDSHSLGKFGEELDRHKKFDPDFSNRQFNGFNKEMHCQEFLQDIVATWMTIHQYVDDNAWICG